MNNGKGMQGIGQITCRSLSSYYSYSKECFSVCCYGTSRSLEIILGFGYGLGLEFKDIPQDQQVIA